jgi:hypothetical protein
MAAAGLWTTASDLASAGIDLQLALKGETNHVLSPRQAEHMLRPGIDDAIGIGFFLSGKGHTQRFTHNGWDEGFVAQMTMYREGGKGAVVMVNSNEGQPLLDEIERAIAREYKWPDYFPEEKPTIILDSKLADSYAGEYSGRAFKCELLSHAGKLFLKPSGQPRIELHPETETNFVANVLNLKVRIKRDADGAVKGLSLDQDGRKMDLDRRSAERDQH